MMKKPQNFQELHPQLMQQIGGWQKHEKPLERSALLAEKFLVCDGKGEVPGQIHSCLSTNLKDLRNKPKKSCRKSMPRTAAASRTRSRVSGSTLEFTL